MVGVPFRGVLTSRKIVPTRKGDRDPNYRSCQETVGIRLWHVPQRGLHVQHFVLWCMLDEGNIFTLTTWTTEFAHTYYIQLVRQ